MKMERVIFFVVVVIYFIFIIYCVCKVMYCFIMLIVDVKDVRDVYVIDCNIKIVIVFGDVVWLFIYFLKFLNDQGELCGKKCFVIMIKL